MSLVNQASIRDQIELIKRTVAKGCTDLELELFIKQCERTGLDPFARQIYAVKRYDSQARTDVMQTQVSIDGLRSLAADTGEAAGQVGPEWCGPDGIWRDVWLQKDPPRAAKVIVLRAGQHKVSALYTGVALWDSYCQTTREGRPTKMWSQMGPEMLAKCAEALALRKAFPQSLSGLYTGDEMGQASNETRSDLPKSTERPLQGPVTASTPLPGASPVLAPPNASTGHTGAKDGALRLESPPTDDPLAPMRRAVTVALGRLTMDGRSLALAKGDAEKLQLPDEKSFTSDQANRWLAIVKEVMTDE